MPRILLIEDNEMNRDMLSRRLERYGYEVIVAVDGDQGVESASTQAPDLILMDMSLPVLDGWEASRQLKSSESTQAIPIIALTAHSMPGDADKAREAGCDDYDTKPVEFPRLIWKSQGQEGVSLGVYFPSIAYFIRCQRSRWPAPGMAGDVVGLSLLGVSACGAGIASCATVLSGVSGADAFAQGRSSGS